MAYFTLKTVLWWFYGHQLSLQLYWRHFYFCLSKCILTLLIFMSPYFSNVVGSHCCYNPSFRIASGTARSYIGQSSPGHSDGVCYWLNEVAILVVSATFIIWVFILILGYAVVFCVVLDPRLCLFVSHDFILCHDSPRAYNVKQDVFYAFRKVFVVVTVIKKR